jgi:hypothetical protein
MSPALRRRALAVAAAVSVIVLVGLAVVWSRSYQRSWTLTCFRWNYRGDLNKAISQDAVFRISGGEIGFQTVSFYGPYPLHRRYYQRMGEHRFSWRTRLNAELSTPLTETNGWPHNYGFRHGGEEYPGSSQSWGLVLPPWGVFLLIAICPALWGYRALRLHLRPNLGYTSTPSNSATPQAVAGSGSAGMPQNHAR